MFFDSQLKAIQRAKERLAVRSQLHRSVIRLELHTAGQTTRQSLRQAVAGLGALKFALDLLGKLKRG